jgi:hypothetical protein
MKKIVFLTILIFITGLIVSCSDSSGGDSDTGYVDPGNWSGIDVKTKSFSLTGFGSCALDTDCLAIIYQGKLNGTQYVGIAAKDISGTPSLKIYWQASSVPFGTTNISAYTVNLNGTITAGTNLSVTISDNGDGTYHIIFNSPVAGTSIDTPNNINALKV